MHHPLWRDVLHAIGEDADPGDARLVWQDALVLFGSRTYAAFEEQAHLSVDGPWLQNRVTLLKAVDLLSGKLLVIKLLPRHEQRYRLSAKGEMGAVTDLQLETYPLEGPLVRMEPIKVMLEGASPLAVDVGPGDYTALKMRRFVSVLRELPQLSDKLIYGGGLRLKAALDYMHERGRVHCDVKGSNVLLTEDGHWFLGDYGASVKTGETVWSCTEVSVHTVLAQLRPEQGIMWHERMHGLSTCLLEAIKSPALADKTCCLSRAAILPWKVEVHLGGPQAGLGHAGGAPVFWSTRKRKRRSIL